MQVGFIGLGKMGKHMVLRLLPKHEVVVYNPSPAPLKEVARKGAHPAVSIADVATQLRKPRIIWMMVPSSAVDTVLSELRPVLSRGDIVIDGGNSFYKDSVRRYASLKEGGISFVDVGTSGGLAAATRGYCFMAGGDPASYKRIEPILRTMAIQNGYGHMGQEGSGHYVKMIHNAIEYGMMQAIGEGLELLQKGTYKNLNLPTITDVWNNGSIIESYLMKLTHQALRRPGFDAIKDYVQDTGEGRWSIIEATENNVPFTVNTYALFARYASRQQESFSSKMIAALRQEFGGHEVKKK